MEDRNYVIFDADEVDKINFTQVLETSAETLRFSVDGTKTFVKFEGSTPACLDQVTSKSESYSHSEILVILATEEWTNPNPMGIPE
jgi:hypothetical protein